jgi:hypothetical protein
MSHEYLLSYQALRISITQKLYIYIMYELVTQVLERTAKYGNGRHVWRPILRLVPPSYIAYSKPAVIVGTIKRQICGIIVMSSSVENRW